MKKKSKPRLYDSTAEKHRVRYYRRRAIGIGRLSVWLSVEQHSALLATAADRGMTLSQVIAAAINRATKHDIV